MHLERSETLKELIFNGETQDVQDVIYKRQVHYYETDKMAIVHHSNYIRWFEEARLYFMTQGGLPYTEMEEAGIMIPVVSVEAKYIQSVVYGQTINIHVWLSFFNGIRMKCGYKITNEQGQLCSTGASEHCFVDGDFKPVSLKKSYPEFYEIFKANVREV